jgi:hypothetical protein
MEFATLRGIFVSQTHLVKVYKGPRVVYKSPTEPKKKTPFREI